jgi:hypothetical protein
MTNPMFYRAARPESAREAREGSLGRRSVELRASGAVGWRWRALFGCQMVWNKSTRRAGERGEARVGRRRWLRILTITGGSSIAAMIFKALPQFG